jgi:hypothetical protein
MHLLQFNTTNKVWLFKPKLASIVKATVMDVVVVTFGQDFDLFPLA